MHVIIAGGGVAGLEALLALSALAEGLVEVDLLSPTDEFVYRPMLVAEPFGGAEALTLELPGIAQESRARHVKDALASVDAGSRTVTTAGGQNMQYDALLIALGARPVEAIPGALTFGDDAERRRFARLLGALGRRGTRRLAFAVPRAATWSIAAYELALLTAAERDVRRLGGVEIALVTHEASPLDLFGSSASRLVADRLAGAGISLHTSCDVDRFERGQLQVAEGGELSADAVVALPALEVQPVPGMPQRRNGFIQTDNAMHVAGLEAVWAAGDASWFPIKQGGLAAQQADVAARMIAARAGAHVPTEPFQPVLRAALITGDSPEFMRSRLGRRPPDAAAAGKALWWPPSKIAGRYLAPYIARAVGRDPGEELADLEPSIDPGADRARHSRAVSLLLAAADGDARIGDFEGALRWLSLVEQLNMVIPTEYVTRRYEWRRQLRPDLAPDQATARIDPTFASVPAALSDIQRRIGWLRELEHRTEGEIHENLSRLEESMVLLDQLSRRAGL